MSWRNWWNRLGGRSSGGAPPWTPAPTSPALWYKVAPGYGTTQAGDIQAGSPLTQLTAIAPASVNAIAVAGPTVVDRSGVLYAQGAALCEMPLLGSVTLPVGGWSVYLASRTLLTTSANAILGGDGGSSPGPSLGQASVVSQRLGGTNGLLVVSDGTTVVSTGYSLTNAVQTGWVKIWRDPDGTIYYEDSYGGSTAGVSGIAQTDIVISLLFRRDIGIGYQYMSDELHELLVYDRVLTVGEDIAVKTYLNQQVNP